MNEVMDWFKESVMWATVDAVFTIVSILVTIGTFIMVIKNYYENKKQLEQIKLFILDKQGKKILIPSYILRKNFNRVEVKGILKELHTGSEYEIDYISNPKSSFLKDIFDIQCGIKDELQILIKSDDDFVLKDLAK